MVTLSIPQRGPIVESPPTAHAQHPALSASTISLTLVAVAAGWGILFGYLAVVRHLAGGSHAEDLGFTDQVLWNSLHGHLFHMSIYNGAEAWNTELNLAQMARPDSLLAFHFEPMLLGLLPLYALGGMTGLLILQSIVLGAGAIPAFRIARHLTGSAYMGLAIATAYLLSPLGQWAVLADFHTSTLAAPLLLLGLDRLLVARKHVQAVALTALALTAREDVAPVVILLGCALLLGRHTRVTGAVITAIGVASLAVALGVIHMYSGGATPFEVRYAQALHDPFSALTRPVVAQYLTTLLLSGGWLALLGPVALLPAVPSLLLNILSSSPWMASGQAHYSALVLPFIVLGAAFALARLRAWPRLQRCATLGLVCTSILGYALSGAGPLAPNFAPALVTDHATTASDLAASLPPDAAVSASSSLVPHLSQRQRAYVFPAVLDADYVFVDLRASPAPTSAGDVYLRVQSLRASGDWHVDHNADGLLLLSHVDGPDGLTLSHGSEPDGLVLSQVRDKESGGSAAGPKLIAAELVPSPDGAVDVDGPQWILRTTWQTDQQLSQGVRPEFWINLSTGETLHRWDIADLWWNPPDHWPVGQPVTIDIPDIPKDVFQSWSATWTQP